MVPEIKRRIEILLASGFIVPSRRQIGLEFQVGKIVEQMPFFRDTPVDDRHVVVGRQRKTVLHGNHGHNLLSMQSGHTASSIWASPLLKDHSSRLDVLMMIMTSSGLIPGASSSNATKPLVECLFCRRIARFARGNGEHNKFIRTRSAEIIAIEDQFSGAMLMDGLETVIRAVR